MEKDVSIFIVEDDVHLNHGIGYALKKDGYQILAAQSLTEAKTILQKQTIHLMILDLNLPDGDGVDFCRELRRTSNLPILMLTARDMETDEIIGLESGADDYLTKPFSLAILKSRIANILRIRSLGEDRQNAVRYQELTWNPVEIKIYRNENSLDLTVTEYRLLANFMTNIGHVLTKNQLLTMVWDNDGKFVDENTLAVNINRLRKKLDKEDQGKYIKTIFGIGYQFGE